MKIFFSAVGGALLGVFLLMGLVGGVGYMSLKPEARAYFRYLYIFPTGEIGKHWTIMSAEWHQSASGTACLMDYPGYITLKEIRSNDELIFEYTSRSPYGERSDECMTGTPYKKVSTDWFRGFIAAHGGTPG